MKIRLFEVGGAIVEVDIDEQKSLKDITDMLVQNMV
jgi:hypothetical protein